MSLISNISISTRRFFRYMLYGVMLGSVSTFVGYIVAKLPSKDAGPISLGDASPDQASADYIPPGCGGTGGGGSGGGGCGSACGGGSGGGACGCGCGGGSGGGGSGG